jgi:putative ABC transport system permease protein
MRLAIDAVRRRPGRSAVTILGVGLATGLVVLLLALSAGVQSSATRLAAASGIDLLATSANTSLSSGNFPPLVDAHSLAGAVARADPNVASASPWLVGDLVYANSSLFSASNASPSGSGIPGGWTPTSAGGVGWIPGENTGIETPGIVAGKGFTSPGDPHFANGSYDGPFTHQTEIDQGLAGLLHVGVGDTVWVSSIPVAGPAGLAAWFANATPFQVVGITEPFWLIPSALIGFFYLSELQTVLGDDGPGQDYASLLLIHLTDPTDPANDQAILSKAFPSLTLFTIGNVLGVIQQAVDLYRTFGVIIGAIGLVVATLFTTTVLLMSVDDRSREIALLRAVGYSRARVGGLVLEEGLLLGALGLAVGLVLGAISAFALNTFLDRLLAGLPNGFSFVSVDPAVILGGALEVIAVALLASVLPAVRAMQLPVAEELRAP